MKTKFLFIALTFIGWFHAPIKCEQSFHGFIKGRVADADGKAISKAVIRAEPAAIVVFSDEDGRFCLASVPSGTIELTASQVGYDRKKIIFEVRTDSTFDIGTIVLNAREVYLGEMVVTATRSENISFDLPSPLNIIPARKIFERTAKTSAEALREEVGIFVQKTSHGGGSAIIRGLSSNQLLILVDGVRLNNSTYRLGNHQYLTTVDDNMLAQIEIVRGPHSLLYGSDAMAGAINLITKTPAFSEQGFSIDYRWLNRYASADEEKTSYAEASVAGKKMSLMLGLAVKKYGDLRRGENSHYEALEKSKNGALQSPTAFNASDANAKLSFKVDDKQIWTLAYQRCYQEKVPRYDKYENDGYYRWWYHPQKRDLLYLNYENHLRSKLFANMKGTVSYHRQQEGRWQQKRIDSELTIEDDVVHTFGLTVHFNPSWSRHSLIYGVEAYHDLVASEASVENPVTKIKTIQPRGRFPDGSVYRTLGLYAQHRWQIAPYFSILLGARWSYISTRFTVEMGTVRQHFDALTGGLGLVYSLSPSINLVSNIGQAFRAPNLSDLTKLGESKGHIYEIPNVHLEPEKMLSIDVGLKIDSEPLTATLSAYYARIYDLLASANDLYQGSPIIIRNGEEYIIKSKQNIGKAFIRGLELSFDYAAIGSLHLYGNGCFTYGQNTTLDEPVGGIPPMFGLVGVKYSGQRMWLTAYSRFAGKQSRLSADDRDDPRIPVGGTPGWQIFNLRLGGKPLPWCRLQFAIENILDLNYREHGSGVNGPGRNFILSIDIDNRLQKHK